MSREASLSRARFVSAAAMFWAGAMLFGAASPAQHPVAANQAALRKFVDASNKIPPEVRNHLSRGLQNYLRYANAAVNGTRSAGPNSVASKQKRLGWNSW